MALDPAFPSLSLIALSVLALIGLAGLGFSAFWHARARKQAERACAAANAQRQDAVRLVRLVGHDLHEQGLSLLGQAGQLKQAGVTAAEWLSTSAGLLLGLADELGAYGLPDSDAHILRDQTMDLHAALAQAVAAAASQLGSGRRSWRLPAANAPYLMRADARALRHILLRVLANAIRHTGQDDWIEIALTPHAEGLAITVQDEGSGLVSTGAAAVADSRGIGLRLALARNLMLAHGGRLEVEAQAGVGSQIKLIFPASRLA